MIRTLFISVSLAFPASAFAQGLTVEGSFMRMMHQQDTSGVVSLDSLGVPGGWGVGAMAGLMGEVVILDGRVLVSRGDDLEGRTTAPAQGEKAALLAYGTVADWRKLALPHDMDLEALARFVSTNADGLDLSAGFPLRLEGRFPVLNWHVVAGAPAAGGHDMSQGMPQGPMNRYEEQGVSGQIVGIFAGSTNIGAASHPGQPLHLHYISEGAARSGHVDDILFPAGTDLWLPDPSAEAASPGPTPKHQSAMMAVSSNDLPTEAGQGAFATIAEIVAILTDDPATDWSKVDIEALRQHLIDMDNVTLRASVAVEEVVGGARFVATSADPAVVGSIRRMVTAHAATMTGSGGWTMTAEDMAAGAALTVTGQDADRIRALGFLGVMTVGMHHQAHHLALAKGQMPH